MKAFGHCSQVNSGCRPHHTEPSRWDYMRKLYCTRSKDCGSGGRFTMVGGRRKGVFEPISPLVEVEADSWPPGNFRWICG